MEEIIFFNNDNEYYLDIILLIIELNARMMEDVNFYRILQKQNADFIFALKPPKKYLKKRDKYVFP